MKKFLSFFAAMLFAVAVNAQTDFSGGYNCAADDAVLVGTVSSSFGLNTDAEPHYIFWSDRALSAPAAATWQVQSSLACYINVTLDLGPVVGSNKHIFEVRVYDANGAELGMVKEAAENTDSEMQKVLDGTILIPGAGTYTVELVNNRDWGKGAVKNIILSFAGIAPVTDFAAPGYSCAADDAVLVGTVNSSFGIKTDAEPHYIFWSDRALSAPAAATWNIMATRGCYVTVTLDLGPVVGSNKHIFEVSVKNASEAVLGTVKEAAENTDSEMQKVLDGTILIPAAGTYTVELVNNRDWGKGAVKNVILTYSADAPEEIIEVTGVELNKSELALEVAEVELLIATVTPDNALDKTVTWESSTPAVATVSEEGFVTAIAEGQTVISAKAGDITATCLVTVSAASIPDVDFYAPCVLSAKKAQTEGAIWKMYTSETYKLYGDGGHNKNYGNALWTINVTRPCIVSGMLNGVEGGHLFELDLYKGEELVATIAHPESKAWSKGEIALEGTLTFATAGNYTLKLRNTQEWSSGKVAGVTLTFVEEYAPVEEIDYFLTGSFNNWGQSDAGYKFAANPEKEGEYMLLNVQLEANAEIKVISSTGTWYPDNAPNCTINDAGTYDIYFLPSGTGDDAWFYGVLYLSKKAGTAIDEISAGKKAVKKIENGQLIILKNGVKYNAIGTIVK